MGNVKPVWTTERNVSSNKKEAEFIMYKRIYIDPFLLAVLIFQIADLVVPSQSLSAKKPKEFSLFSVVTFQNKECTTDTSLTGGATQGTCYSSTECTDKGGTKSGNCASGFGVCCAFLNTAAITSTISENRTRLRNTEFPSTQTATDAKSIIYTINKMSSDICQIRLDFNHFVIGGPANIVETIPVGTGTHCTRDTLTITTTDITAVTSTRTGTLCGALTGEHLYIELSPTATDTATITLNTVITGTLTPTVAQRIWDIKTSQIECFASYRAPLGCDKYMTDIEGKVTSYNFHKNTGTTQAANAQNTGVELATQRVNTCIRRAKGMCCVEYQACAMYNGENMIDMNNAGGNDDGSDAIWNFSFSIDLNTSPMVIETTVTNQGMTDDQCTTDYIEIPSSWSGACGGSSTGNRATINTRFCGSKFGANPAFGIDIFASTPVCDCSEPFVVRHQTDDLNDVGGLDAADNAPNPNQLAAGTTIPRGFCLDYRQTSCWH